MQVSSSAGIIVMTGTAIGCAIMGTYFSGKKYWTIVFSTAFMLFLAILCINRTPSLHYHLTVSWFFKGHRESLMFSILLPVIFGVLIPKLKLSRQRLMVWGLAVVGTGYLGIVPVVEGVIVHSQLEGLETWREDGICLQTTGFTCGPASAVTALEYHGIKAEESELAMAANTTPSWGTSSRDLADAIEKLYGRQGIRCRIKKFDSVESMQHLCPIIAIVKHSFMVDHYITVLNVEEDVVLVGDPLKGQERLSYEAFEEKWRRVGIIVKQQ